MRKGLIITTILAAMLVGVLMFSVYLMEQKEERMELYHQQMQMLEEQAAKLDVKEAQLNELVQRYENGQTDGAAELAAMKTELETLQAEKQELQLQLEQAIADVQAMRQQLENEDSDQSYYFEVYNALTEGLNKVKGYIAGN
jgi:chromosome segregation ATPase